MKLKLLGACLLLVLALTACSTSKSFTLQLEQGKQLEVTLETGEGYNLSVESGDPLWLYVQKDDALLLEGILLSTDRYAEYVQGITAADDVEILTAEPEEAPVSYVYQWEAEDGTRTDFLFPIEGLEYAGLFESSASYEEAEAAFRRLSFEAVS